MNITDVANRLHKLGLSDSPHGSLTGFGAIESLKAQQLAGCEWSEELRIALLDFVQVCGEENDMDLCI